MTAAEYNFEVEQGSTFNPTLTYQSYYRKVTDAAMTVSTTTLSSSTAAFTAGDVGRYVSVAGAGTGRGALTTTISSITSATAVVIGSSASYGVNAAELTIFTPVDLTGYTARMTVKDSAGTQLVALTSSSGITLGDAAGTIAISISATATAAYYPKSYNYDLEIVSVGHVVTKLLRGLFIVSGEVTT